MNYSEEQLSVLKNVSPFISTADEGEYTYILIEKLKLPNGCIPSETDVLLCPAPRLNEGYTSRLFFSEQISGNFPQRNWNGNVRVLSRNWFAISWNVAPDSNFLNLLSNHLRALRNVAEA